MVIKKKKKEKAPVAGVLFPLLLTRHSVGVLLS